MTMRAKMYTQLIVWCVLAMVLIGGCSSDTEDEPGAIKQATDAIARQGVDYIKTPIEQAKRAQELSEAHNKTVSEAAARQE